MSSMDFTVPSDQVVVNGLKVEADPQMTLTLVALAKASMTAISPMEMRSGTETGIDTPGVVTGVTNGVVWARLRFAMQNIAVSAEINFFMIFGV